VIHCLGPVYGRDEPADKLLAACFRRALELAGEHGLESIAFPAISTGAFGYPLAEAAKIALRTVAAKALEFHHVRRIRFVLWGQEALKAHKSALKAIGISSR